MLRTLLEGPIVFTPIIEDERRGVTFAGRLAIGEIWPEMSTPEGWRPRGESNRCYLRFTSGIP